MNPTVVGPRGSSRQNPRRRARTAETADTEPDELSERILGLIGTYAMGALDADELHRARVRPPAETAAPSNEGWVEDGIYHVAE